MTLTVDIVIVNYNNRGDLSACLTSIFDAPPRALGRVFVVDNASTDGSTTMVGTNWPDVALMALDSNRGFAAANNVAIRQAAAPLVLLLNSDTLVTAAAIDTLVHRLDATGAVAAGPLMVDGDGRPEVSFGPMLSPLAEIGQSIRVRLAARRGLMARMFIRRLVARERTVDWVSGGCLLVRRQAALNAGLLDERYFLYEEDVDFCAALRADGGTILFTPQARIVHLRGRSVGRSGTPPTGHYDRSHLAFYEKHCPRWAPALRWWLQVRGRNVR
jgi:N-acetylglucosaminyl-diphospho-decaprenol L-rhamnosyltransferase